MQNVAESNSQTSTSMNIPRPRRRAGILSPPPSMDLSISTPPLSPQEESPRSISPARTPPPTLPARSPLRPTPKSVSSFTTLIAHYTNRDTMATLANILQPSEPGPMPADAMNSLTALLDMYELDTQTLPPTPTSMSMIPDDFSPLDRRFEDKPLPLPPDVDDDDDDDESSLGSLTATVNQSVATSETSTLSNVPTTGPRISKRTHVLNELLSSERAYASDLAFIRDVHIPLALGQAAPFHYALPDTPPSSSGSSTRTVSTASSSSSSSVHGPPMTKEDARMIFSNITELAVFSDTFSEKLEEALGDVLEDGKGEDWVGYLFLELIPAMEPLYKTYITRHPVAIQHLSSLPKTPALTSYLSQTQSLASSVTHSWDLPSLLIKPVQRLLKYPLLLGAIIEQTPDGHGDKENLRKAMTKMEEVARAVNEGRRRLEVVKEILTGKTDMGVTTGVKKKMSVSKSASVSIGRMKGIGVGLRGSRPKEDNGEAMRVDAYEQRLKDCESFVREFAKDTVSWSACVRKSVEHLRAWALCFSRSIGISEQTPSEAFSAFLDVLDLRLLPLCSDLDSLVGKELLPQLACLLDTAKSPARLLAAMHSFEVLHTSLLNLNYSKQRPPQAMIEASQNYVALRGQLHAELPTYLSLLDKGIVRCVRQFAHRQTEFWFNVRVEWASLWECLRMEGETNAGCEETLRLWWNRYSEVSVSMSKLTIIKRDKIPNHLPSTPASPPPPSRSESSRHRSFGSMDAPITPLRNVHRSPSTESFPTGTYRNKSRPRSPESLGRRNMRSATSPLPASSSSPTLNMYPSSASLQGQPGRDHVDWSDTHSVSDTNGRKSRSSSFSRRLSESLRAPLRRTPSHKSFGSTGSAGGHAGSDAGHTPPMPMSLADYPAKYFVMVVHPFRQPQNAVYRDQPFFDLNESEVFAVLDEAGHPSKCEGLPLVVDSEDDCLLLVRNDYREIGWLLASFVVPVQ